MSSYKGIYIQFIEIPTDAKTSRFKVLDRDGLIELGVVRFRPQWRAFVFEPNEDTVFDTKCLNEIIVFLNNQHSLWLKGLEIREVGL